MEYYFLIPVSDDKSSEFFASSPRLDWSVSDFSVSKLHLEGHVDPLAIGPPLEQTWRIGSGQLALCARRLQEFALADCFVAVVCAVGHVPKKKYIFIFLHELFLCIIFT
jgi:hypothetical protein